MFGQPTWFRKKRIGWGLAPVTWQGWVYSSVWGGVMTLPFLLLIWRQQLPEALVWLLFSIGVLIWDVRKIIQAMDREQRKNMLFIDDEEAQPVETRPVETQAFDLRVGD